VDQGSQFTSYEFMQVLKDTDVKTPCRAAIFQIP